MSGDITSVDPKMLAILKAIQKGEQLPKPYGKEVFILKTYIAGTQYYEAKNSHPKIATFGHDDSIYTFLVGCSAKVSLALWDDFADFAKELPENVLRLNTLKDLSVEEKKRLKDELDAWYLRQEARLDKSKASSIMGRQYTPVREFLRDASLDQLTKTAERLIDLAVFRSELGPEEDRVIGGPVKVAAISKDKGFSKRGKKKSSC